MGMRSLSTDAGTRGQVGSTRARAEVESGGRRSALERSGGWPRLVGFANVDAVNRGVGAREPAFGLGADVLLVLQALVRAGVHGEDDQERVGDGLVRGGRCCRS